MSPGLNQFYGKDKDTMLAFFGDIQKECRPGIWTRIPDVEGSAENISFLFRFANIPDDTLFYKIAVPCIANCKTQVAKHIFSGLCFSKKAIETHRDYLRKHIDILSVEYFSLLGLSGAEVKKALDSQGYTPEKLFHFLYFSMTRDAYARKLIIDSIQKVSTFEQARTMILELVPLKDRDIIVALFQKLWKSDLVKYTQNIEEHTIKEHIRSELVQYTLQAYKDSIPKCEPFPSLPYARSNVSYQFFLSGLSRDCHDRTSAGQSQEKYRKVWNDFSENWSRFFSLCMNVSVDLRGVPDTLAFAKETNDVLMPCTDPSQSGNLCLDKRAKCETPFH